MSGEDFSWGKTRLWVFWLIVLTLGILPRVLLELNLPVYLFSDDSHSYLLSAFNWTQTGDWETSPRRGAVYSLLIAGVLAVWRDLRWITVVQHILGGCAVLGAIAVFRSQVPRKLFWPALAAASGFAVSAFPIFYEHTVRSEVLLFAFSTVCLGSWCVYQTRGGDWLLVLTGLGFALATLVKNLLLPLPVIVALAILLDGRAHCAGKMRRLGLLALGIALPFLGNSLFNRIGGPPPEAAPQSGILLYGRVAQWTVLDAGPNAEVKKLIRDDILAYRQLPRLNNNILLKKTAVPRMDRWLLARGGSRADLNRLCRELAFEAIRNQPGRWASQIWDDCRRLHWKMTFPVQTPGAEELEDAHLSTTKLKHQDPMLQQARVLSILADPATLPRLRSYQAVVSGAWLFLWHPVLLTSLLLPVLAWVDRSHSRGVLWLGFAAIWFFNVAIICTVGRPIPRYLAAALPIMFWTLGGAILWLTGWLASLWKIRQPAA